MSPNRLDVTTIWNRSGRFTMNMEAASTSREEALTSGYSRPTSAKIWSQNTME